jgi:dUTP pyrophosphatase
MEIKDNVIYFSKVSGNDAIIPSKREEDAGFDIYACFEASEIIISPHQIIMIPTGIATAFSNNYVLIIKERSSTGSKGMSVRMGVIDSGYRGEIFIAINNTSSKTIVIKKDDSLYEENENDVIYDYKKAIAQAILIPVPKVQSKEISYDELKEFSSERAASFLGASGK